MKHTETEKLYISIHGVCPKIEKDVCLHTYNEMIDFADKRVDQLEQRNRELVEALNRVSNCNDIATAREYASEVLTKYSAPAGQKGGENG